MGRGRKRRQRKQHRAAETQRPFRVAPLSIEIAHQHDGLLRGPVETRCVAVLYAILDEHVTMLARTLFFADARSTKVPQKIPLDLNDDMVASFASTQRFHVALWLSALEEDGGKDVQNTYADLEHEADVAFWLGDDPIPRPIESLAHGPLDVVRPVTIAIAGRALHDATSDKFIGSAVICFSLGPGARRIRRDVRFAFRSEDGKNQWTYTLRLHFG